MAERRWGAMEEKEKLMVEQGEERWLNNGRREGKWTGEANDSNHRASPVIKPAAHWMSHRSRPNKRPGRMPSGGAICLNALSERWRLRENSSYIPKGIRPTLSLMVNPRREARSVIGPSPSSGSYELLAFVAQLGQFTCRAYLHLP